jgi:hypothetical protein
VRVKKEKDNAERGVRSAQRLAESSVSFAENSHALAEGSVSFAENWLMFAEKTNGAVTTSNNTVSIDLVLVPGVYSYRSAGVRF